jgi:hypothetical protein
LTPPGLNVFNFYKVTEFCLDLPNPTINAAYKCKKDNE